MNGYKFGNRKLISKKVDVTAESDVRALNLLQAVNAVESLYFNDSISNEAVRTLARKAAKYRTDESTRLIEYQPSTGDVKKDGILLRQYRCDVRTRLELQCAEIIPHAKRYEVGGRIVHRRDPVLFEVHKRFVVAVRAGQYQISEWNKFLIDNEDKFTLPS